MLKFNSWLFDRNMINELCFPEDLLKRMPLVENAIETGNWTYFSRLKHLQKEIDLIGYSIGFTSYKEIMLKYQNLSLYEQFHINQESFVVRKMDALLQKRKNGYPEFAFSEFKVELDTFFTWIDTGATLNETLIDEFNSAVDNKTYENTDDGRWKYFVDLKKPQLLEIDSKVISKENLSQLMDQLGECKKITLFSNFPSEMIQKLREKGFQESSEPNTFIRPEKTL